MDRDCEVSSEKRERFWDEMKTDKQIETLREFLIQMVQSNRDLRRKVDELQKHHHAADGKLLVPLTFSNTIWSINDVPPALRNEKDK